MVRVKVCHFLEFYLFICQGGMEYLFIILCVLEMCSYAIRGGLCLVIYCALMCGS